MDQASTPVNHGLPNGGTPPARRKRRNRSILIALIVAALGASATLVPQFQEDAAALDDARDISWDMSGGASAYNAMIDAVRRRATDRPANAGSSTLREGILQTNPASTELFSVDVVDRNVGQSSTDPSGFRLLMRASDLFVIGWLVTRPTGESRVVFLHGDDNGYRGANGNAAMNELTFNGSYGGIEGVAGRTRSGLAMNIPAWDNAFRTIISTVAGEADEQTIARALLMFIPGIAEAARFDPLQTAFAPTFEGVNSHTITAAEANLMNNWSRASTATLDSLNNGAVINFSVDDPATPEVDFLATSLTSMAAILAICLISL